MGSDRHIFEPLADNAARSMDKYNKRAGVLFVDAICRVGPFRRVDLGCPVRDARLGVQQSRSGGCLDRRQFDMVDLRNRRDRRHDNNLDKDQRKAEKRSEPACGPGIRLRLTRHALCVKLLLIRLTGNGVFLNKPLEKADDTCSY